MSAPPTDSERRRRRDAQIRSIDERIGEQLEAARRSGELQSAESYGRPLSDVDGWFETPAEFRMPFRILRNAGVAPPEIALFHQRAALRRELDTCTSEPRRAELALRLSELEQVIALRLESLRGTRTL